MISQERQRSIDQQRESVRHDRLWCKDEWRSFEVFRVPVEALLLNAENRRFAAERRLMEQKLGRALDPENVPVDEKSVITILLDTSLDVDGDRVVGKPTKDFEALREDWLNRGQETPFWIRPNGLVRNGNRRLAMLKRLEDELGNEGRKYVEAIILSPEDVNEQQLFEMEQREQLTENLKIRYTDINLLLTLREAANLKNIDWADPNSIDQVAGDLKHLVAGDKLYAAIQLGAIRYMDAYLSLNNAAGLHQNLIGQIERFRDVGKIMSRMEQDYPDDAPDMLRLAFAAISAGNTHGDIRVLWKIFKEDRDRFRSLLSRVENIEQQSQQGGEIGPPGVIEREAIEDVETEPDPPGPVVSNYPSERVRSLVKNAIDGWNASNLDVLSQLDQVVGRLRSLTTERLSTSLAGDEATDTRTFLEEIVAWSDQARQNLG